jgi:hypothetical protein
LIESIIKNLVDGVTLIEDEFGSVNKILSRQIGSFASTAGRKVCFLEPPDRNFGGGGAGGVSNSPVPGMSSFPDSSFDVPAEDLENTGLSLKNSVVFRTDQRYLPLEELKFDLIIFDSFSNYIFGKSDKEVSDLMDEIARLSRGGKSFVLTSETGMLSDRVNAYVRAVVDTVIIVKTEIAQYKVNRLLYIPKMKGAKPLDHVIKITIEEGGVDIDTREFVG